jgi:hypothetical protein
MPPLVTKIQAIMLSGLSQSETKIIVITKAVINHLKISGVINFCSQTSVDHRG